MKNNNHSLVLLATANFRVCAFPLPYVVETMRPLPIETLPGLPPFVKGLSIIRGAPIPVVDLGFAVGNSPGSEITRFITLRVGERQVALAVQAVAGVSELDPEKLQELPPLLGKGDADMVEAISATDSQLFLVLRAARIVPEEVWRVLESRSLKS
jgi:purine-binding chemotaxis protein CheW